MIDPDKLADHLTNTAQAVRARGDVTWGRVHDWTLPGRMPARGERGGGMGPGAPDERIDDRREDAAAARYHTEMQALTKRLDADLARLTRIISICCPVPPKTLANRDLLAAQVAADGWCVSCWRDDQHLTPITTQRTRNGTEVPLYKDRCRWCGEWRSHSRQDPPLDVLQAHHEGRRIRVRA